MDPNELKARKMLTLFFYSVVALVGIFMLLGLIFLRRYRVHLSVVKKEKESETRARFMAALIFMALTTQAGAEINGELTGGGDPFDKKLVDTRERVVRALSLVKFGYRSEILCEPCAHRELCAPLRWLSKEQREECRAFSKEMADQVLRQYENGKIVVTVASDSLVMKNSVGIQRSLSAATSLGEGPIVFDLEKSKSLSRAGLAQLMAHELGHKVVKGDTLIYDEKPIGKFATGRLLLDTVASAIALLSEESDLPLQKPTSLPSDKAFCKGISSFDQLYGRALAADLKAPSIDALTTSYKDEASRQEAASRLLNAVDSRRETIRSWYSDFLKREAKAEELEYLSAQWAKGASPDTILAAIFSDSEYEVRRETISAEKFVTSVFWDLLGRAPAGEEFSVAMTLFKTEGKPALVVKLLHQNEGFYAKLVGRWYRRYLNRSPSNRELRENLSRLKAGASWEMVQSAILAGQEYYLLQGVRWTQCSR